MPLTKTAVGRIEAGMRALYTRRVGDLGLFVMGEDCALRLLFWGVYATKTTKAGGSPGAYAIAARLPASPDHRPRRFTLVWAHIRQSKTPNRVFDPLAPDSWGPIASIHVQQGLDRRWPAPNFGSKAQGPHTVQSQP
jgi:hypothetical protein